MAKREIAQNDRGRGLIASQYFTNATNSFCYCFNFKVQAHTSCKTCIVYLLIEHFNLCISFGGFLLLFHDPFSDLMVNIVMHLQQTVFENIVATREIAHHENVCLEVSEVICCTFVVFGKALMSGSLERLG